MRRNLSGRKLVITGAARGIGEKVARLAAARGARVALIGLEPAVVFLADDRAHRVLARGRCARRHGLAVGDRRLCADHGGIDAVVANAGIAAYGTVRQADEASFE